MAFPHYYSNQYYYDVYPLVVQAGKETVIHIRPLGGRREFEDGQPYTARFSGHTGGSPWYYPSTCDVQEEIVYCNPDGGFELKHTFAREQEYALVLEIPVPPNTKGKAIQTFHFFCVGEDLVGLYPYLGDLHMHTTGSDGREIPEVVCANYRAYGYDFLAITDHRRYYPSLRAMDFYRDVPTELTIVPGEEVHLPKVKAGFIEPHIVNFGGQYSINALVEAEATSEVGSDWQTRSLTPDCPPVMTKEAFSDLMDACIANTHDIPEGIDPIAAVGSQWIFEQIRKAGGLSIYAHPMWITRNAYHVPDVLQDYLVEHRKFDAFEVLGGESYFEENGYQTIRYYEDAAKGRRYPVVGNTDTHCSYPTNPNAFVACTIVFSAENERQALIDSIRAHRSVAVDTISKEFRLVGDMRLVRYACFLLKNYFPFHDEMCQEEGRMMRQVAVGTENEKRMALQVLHALKGRMAYLKEKYFDF